jgi:hypothetical protein
MLSSWGHRAAMTLLQKHQRQMWLGYVRTWRGPVPGTCHLLIRARPLSCVASTRPRSTDKILPSDPFEHFTKRFWPEHRKLRRTRNDYCANSRPCEVTLLILRAPAPLVHPLQILAPRASSKMIGRATALFCYWKNKCKFQRISLKHGKTIKGTKNDNNFREQGFSTGFFYNLKWWFSIVMLVYQRVMWVILVTDIYTHIIQILYLIMSNEHYIVVTIIH